MPEMFYDWNYLTCGVSANLLFTYVVICRLADVIQNSRVMELKCLLFIAHISQYCASTDVLSAEASFLKGAEPR